MAEGFHVVETSGIKETALYLKHLGRWIQDSLRDAILLSKAAESLGVPFHSRPP